MRLLHQPDIAIDLFAQGITEFAQSQVAPLVAKQAILSRARPVTSNSLRERERETQREREGRGNGVAEASRN